MCGGRRIQTMTTTLGQILQFPIHIPLPLDLFLSELCISISLNLSSLSWPKQFNVKHKHTKELNDAMICGTVVVIQHKEVGLVYIPYTYIYECERARERTDWIKRRVCPSI